MWCIFVLSRKELREKVSIQVPGLLLKGLPRGREHRIVKDAGTEFEKLGTGRKRIREVFILRVDICVGVCQQFRSCWCGGSPLRGAMRAPQRDSSLIIRFLCPEEREQRPFLSRGGGPSLRD